jgi:hypothetical protein
MQKKKICYGHKNFSINVKKTIILEAIRCKIIFYKLNVDERMTGNDGEVSCWCEAMHHG